MANERVDGLLFLGPKEMIRYLIEEIEKGNEWKTDHYVHGMLNGMVLALSVLEGEAEPEFYP